ncbi:MAG: dihydrodipicolinate synthase family protein [Pseudomonadota bacterium]
MLTRDTLHGFVPAIVTPFDAAGRIDEDAFLAIAAHLRARGASAICVAGDNGESWALSATERGRLTSLLVAEGMPVIVGCSAPTRDAALSYARAGAEAGARALLAMPPTYVMKGSDAEVARRYAALAEIGPPLVLYNSPRRAGHSMSVDLIERLAGDLPVIGIKESHRDWFHHSHLLDRMADRIAVMTGPCHYILPAFALGARGFIATGPELLPGPVDGLAGLTPGSEAYRTAHRQLAGIYETLMGIGTWPAALKAALGLMGLPAGVPRDPVLPLGPEETNALRAAMARLGLL